MPKRPNFILFITDQHRADYLGCMGHPILKTPNIDAIAENGQVWDRFYVASPVCMPNRASLMTCRMPSSHGVRSNGIPLDPRNVTFVELLREAGYKTALIGKSHLQNFSGAPAPLQRPKTRKGFHRAKGQLSEAVRHNHQPLKEGKPGGTSGVETPFYGFDHVEICTGHGDRISGDYRRWLLNTNPDADSLLGDDNQLLHGYVCPQARRTALPEEQYSTTWIADRAADWLQAQQDDDQPYFLMVSFPDPHHPFNPPGKYWDMYSPDDMPVPEAFMRNDWVPPPHVEGAILDREEGLSKLNAMGSVATYAREAQEAQALTCGMIAMIDDAIGRVRAVAGAENAVQIFTTDHGDHLGDHRLLFKGAEQYEQLTHVPFIWADPEGAAGRTDAIGQTHDIGVTVLERAKIEPAIGMQGQSLFNAPRDAAFMQYDHQNTKRGIGEAPRVHTLRDHRWRMSLFDNVDWGELYDLENDPGEFRNLWDDPEHAEIRAELTLKLLRAEIANVDRAPFPSAQA